LVIALLTPFVWSLASPARSAVSLSSAPQDQRVVVLVLLDGVSFEEVMAAPQFRELARTGGVGLMTTAPGTASPRSVIGAGGTSEEADRQRLVHVLRLHGIVTCFEDIEESGERSRVVPPFGPLAGCGHESSAGAMLGVVDLDAALGPKFEQGAQARRSAIDAAALLSQGFLSFAGGPTRVLFVVPSPSSAMDAVGDEVTPMVIGEVGTKAVPPKVIPDSIRALRSDTTRESGLVANVDVSPTILDFFGIPIPKEMTGQPIRVDGTVDLQHLHRVHLDQRRIRLPIQLGEVAFVAALGIVGIAALVWLGVRGSLPPRFRAVMRFLALCGVALPIPLMAGGLLPRLTYWVVVPFLVLSVVALAAAALAARWPGPMGPFRFLGAVGLAFVVLDALFGWRGARIPLLGGTMFDGVRFYGLPNSFIALLLASALLVAVGLEPFTGFLVLLAGGLFAGFPNLGANVGAAITMFVAAGMWWVLRTRRTLGLREVAFASGTVAVGLATVLLANRYLPGAPTHITGFVERTGGLGGTWHAFRRRLDVGFGQIGDVPAALIPLIGLVVVLVLLLAPPRPIRAGLELAGKVWQKVLVAMTVAGIAAFLVNDTGVAAAAPVFLYAMTVLAYAAYLAARRA